MADEHQANTIIATTLLDSIRDHPNYNLEPEEAKVSDRALSKLNSNYGQRWSGNHGRFGFFFGGHRLPLFIFFTATNEV